MDFSRNVFSKATCSLLLLLLATATAAEESVPIVNPHFQQGDDAPTGWTLSGGNGRWVDRQILEVTGNGSDSNFWRCDYRFTPGALYHFEVSGRGTPSSGSAIAGPVFANRDYHTPSPDWISVGHVFRVPDDVTDSYVRLGQWHARGTLQFDSVRLVPALPVHTQVGKLLLGEGESIRDGRYTFSGTFGHQGSNYHRTLHSTTAGFNSDRWTFGSGQQVTYRFELPGHKLLSGRVQFNVNYYIRGNCAAEISTDQTDWRPLATQGRLGTAEAELPKEMLPAQTLYLRLRSSRDGSLQVNRVELAAEVSGTPPDAVGETIFADVESAGSKLTFEHFALKQNRRSGGRTLLVTVKNHTEDCEVRAELTTDPKPNTKGVSIEMLAPLHLLPGKSATEEVPLLDVQTGENRLTLLLNEVDVIKLSAAEDSNSSASRGASGATATVSLTYRVSEYYRSDYGGMLECNPETAWLWWCPATHKVPPQREVPLPAYISHAQLSAARNDREAVQVVLRPTKDLKGLTASAGALTGLEGATIPAENVQILRVAYHFVHHPTDKTGVRDFWPDALPPLDGPIDVPAGQNQPLWVLVHVPDDAKAGLYAGTIALRAEEFSADVQVRLHVWDFALPKRNHIETAFGFSAGNVFRYHGLKSDADKRRVLEMYFQSFADHRISPYDPAPMDPIRVNFLADADPPRAEVDFSAFDEAMTRAVEKYHFTGIRLPVQGMGGGTFHSRSDPRIGRFGENTPEYRAMFSSYVKQLESHFREKDWLKLAYIYWFDEPDPKDYEFVANGMKRLQRYAPGLRRMLTEQPEESPLIGTVDIWCPVSFNYEHEAAQRRRAHGERFWWYVCCGPKEPYCTLFIDHPATELRVWLWQTWQRDIAGILVWSSNYWTTSAAFPDPQRPQNPYEDPMGYVSGYSTPQGTKRYWGNGDGRFIYPALAAAVPGKSGPEPVIAPPASSIRWEMLREGIEDYEMLYMLRELLKKRRDELPPEQVKQYEALLEVPEEITRDMTTFTTDPAPIYTRRAEIAQAIERMAENNGAKR